MGTASVSPMLYTYIFNYDGFYHGEEENVTFLPPSSIFPWPTSNRFPEENGNKKVAHYV